MKERTKDRVVLITMAIGIAGIFYFAGTYLQLRAPTAWFVQWSDVLCLVAVMVWMIGGFIGVKSETFSSW